MECLLENTDLLVEAVSLARDRLLAWYTEEEVQEKLVARAPGRRQARRKGGRGPPRLLAIAVPHAGAAARRVTSVRTTRQALDGPIPAPGVPT